MLAVNTFLNYSPLLIVSTRFVCARVFPFRLFTFNTRAKARYARRYINWRTRLGIQYSRWSVLQLISRLFFPVTLHRLLFSGLFHTTFCFYNCAVRLSVFSRSLRVRSFVCLFLFLSVCVFSFFLCFHLRVQLFARLAQVVQVGQTISTQYYSFIVRSLGFFFFIFYSEHTS